MSYSKFMYRYYFSCRNRYKVRKTSFYLIFVLHLVALSGCEDQLFDDRSREPPYIFDTFWQEVDRNYSFFQDATVDWDSVYKVYRVQITDTTSSKTLFKVFDEMLSLLKDAHTNVYAPMGTAGNIDYFFAFPVNPILADPSGSYFESFTDVNRILGYGKLRNSSLGYLRIKTFQGEKADFEEIGLVLKAFETCTGLIIDVRSNFGGNIANSEFLADRFTDTGMPAYEYRVRNGGKHSDFTPWYKVKLTSDSKKLWNKPVVILTNRGSFSATEWFVLFMDLLPDVKIVGDTTGGGGAVPITRELPNGWVLRVSNTQTRLLSGKMFQRSGIFPDVPVWISKEDEINNVDTILEKAMQLLK